MSQKFVQEFLLNNKEQEYSKFQKKLLPTLSPESVLGVRTPTLKSFAKSLVNTPIASDFMRALPHEFFEENLLHGLMISLINDFDKCVFELEKFLPHIDNWAVCDQTLPKCFAKNKAKLLPYVKKWIASSHTYTIRFGIGMVMKHFLGNDFHPSFLELVANVQSNEYYVNMEIAWFFATALSKQWEHVFPYVKNQKLSKWVNNKTIQKARESFRITKEQKLILQQYKQ